MSEEKAEEVIMRLTVHTEGGVSMDKYADMAMRIQKMCRRGEEAYATAPSGPNDWHFKIIKKGKKS